MKTSTRPGFAKPLPLNVAGAYALPPLPEGFDPHDLSQSLPPPYDETLRHTLRQLPPKSEWILPHLSLNKGRTHLVREAGGRPSSGVENSNWAGGVVLNGVQVPNPAPGSRIACYVTPFNNQEHVVFIGTDQHVYELVYANSEWVWTDLIAVTGAPLAHPAFGITGYATAYNSQQHIFYVDSSNHVHELFFDGAWHPNDLFVAAAVPPSITIAPESALAGYETAWNTQEHVFFIAADHTVQELFRDTGWHLNNVTAAAPGALPAAANGVLAGYVTTANNQQHVVYLVANNHLMELMFDGHWHPNDLHRAAPTALGFPVDPTSTIAGYQTAWNQQQHVMFVGLDRNVHELVFAGSWQISNLTSAAKAPLNPATGSALDGYATNWDQQQHVNFIATDGTVQELFFDGSWHPTDLIKAASSATTPRPGSALFGYSTEYDRQQHVIYIDSTNHLVELFFTSQWQNADLTLAAVTGARIAPLTAAFGTWKVPTVSKPDEPQSATGGYQSSSWVGIDGANTNDVLQTGVEHDVDQDGKASYYAWYEWFAPAQSGSPGYINETQIDNFPISPGDVVSSSVSYNSAFTQGLLMLINGTTGQHFAIALDPPPGAAFLGNSAEWIVEAPSGGEPGTSLPQFTPVTFNPAFATGPGSTSVNPQTGSTRTIFRDSTVLTTTTLGFDQLTVVYLPWHAADLTTLANAPQVGRLSALCGYPTAYNSQHHVIFIGTDSDVHELWYDKGWHTADLTLLSGIPVNAIGGSPLIGYATEFNRQEHVVSVGSDGNLWELFFDNSWHPNNLITAAGGAPLPLSNGPIAGYATGWNQQQHVFYIGRSDGHIHELFFDGGWHPNDLTVATGIVPAAGSALAAYATGFNNQLHVICIDGAHQVQEAFFDGGWHPNNLTQRTAAPVPLTFSALAGMNSEFNRQEHIYYIDGSNHVRELWFDNTWHEDDITALAGASAFLPAAGATLDAYTTEYNQQLHVNYIGAGSLIHELYFDGVWHHNILSQLSAAPAPRASTPLFGYATDYSGQQHVVYIGADGNVHELWL